MCFLKFSNFKIPTFWQLLFFFCNYWHNVNKQHLKSRENVFLPSQDASRKLTYIPPKKKKAFFGWNIWPRIFTRFFLIFTFFGAFTRRENPNTSKKPSGLLIQKKSFLEFKLGSRWPLNDFNPASELLNQCSPIQFNRSLARIKNWPFPPTRYYYRTKHILKYFILLKFSPLISRLYLKTRRLCVIFSKRKYYIFPQ